jgi:hypothetical protein
MTFLLFYSLLVVYSMDIMLSFSVFCSYKLEFYHERLSVSQKARIKLSFLESFLSTKIDIIGYPTKLQYRHTQNTANCVLAVYRLQYRGYQSRISNLWENKGSPALELTVLKWPWISDRSDPMDRQISARFLLSHLFFWNTVFYPTLQRQNTEISKQIFPEKAYRGLSPNFHIQASVSD